MYPDGVRYSFPIELREGAEVGRLRAKLLSILRHHVKSIRKAQELLK